MDSHVMACVAAVALLCAGGQTETRADFIRPTAAWASSTYSADQNVVKIINGTGLSGESPTATHDNQASAMTMWHAANVPANTVELIILLAADTAYDLSQMYIWNHNQAETIDLTGRGISNVTVSVSSDANLESPNWVSAGDYTFAKASGSPTEPCQTLPLAAECVRMVKLDIQSSWDGETAPYVGLSEIRFDGVPVNHVNPMPWTVTGYAAFNASYALRNAVTGTEAEYASQGGGTDTYLVFDFAKATTFDRVIMVQRDSPAAADWFQRIRLTYSADATFDLADPFEDHVVAQQARGRGEITVLTNSTPTRYVRWDVQTLVGSGGSNVGTMEFLFLNRPRNAEEIDGVTVINSATAYNANYAAANVCNGIVGRDSATPGGIEYASAGQGVDTFLDFDLGRTERLTAFDYIDRIGAVDHIDGFDMILSLDATFGNADDITHSYTKGNALAFTGQFDTSILCRYVRFDVTRLASTSDNVGACEVIFYRRVSPGTLFVIR